MKIDLNNVAASQLPVGRGAKQVSSGTLAEVGGATQDRTTFHSDSNSVQALTSKAMSSPEIRQDKVDALSQSVSSGTYKLDAGKIAGAIIGSNG